MKAEKNKYMFVCCEKNTGKDHNIKIYNKSHEKLDDFKYLIITVINKNCIHDKIELI
jgi:hypothetical protein